MRKRKFTIQVVDGEIFVNNINLDLIFDVLDSVPILIRGLKEKKNPDLVLAEWDKVRTDRQYFQKVYLGDE